MHIVRYNPYIACKVRFGVNLDEITSVTVEESSGLRVDDDGRPSRASQWSKALPVYNDHHAERLARARYAARLARARAAIGAAKPGDDEAVKTYVALATVAEQANRVTRSRESAGLALVQMMVPLVTGCVALRWVRTRTGLPFVARESKCGAPAEGRRESK